MENKVINTSELIARLKAGGASECVISAVTDAASAIGDANVHCTMKKGLMKNGILKCSQCMSSVYIGDYDSSIWDDDIIEDQFRYCPNCGAAIDGYE